MYTINCDWHVAHSRRPDWALMFVGMVKGFYDGSHSSMSNSGDVLRGIQSLLDEQIITQRKLQRLGTIIPREIIGDRKIVVYTTVGRTPILTITIGIN